MDAISGPGPWQQDGDAVALCDRVLDQIASTDANAGNAGNAVRRAVKVWVARSHEGNTAPADLSMPSSASLREQARGVDTASVSLTLPSEIVTGKRSGVGKARLPSAASVDKVPLPSVVKQRLGNNNDPLVKKAIVKQETSALKMRFAREKRQTSRRLGHESHCLPDVCVLPTKREVPQAFFATRGWDEDSEGGHEDDGEGAGGEEGGNSEGTTPSNPAIVLRRPARNPGGRTELGHVYPRRTHKDDIHILVNRFKRAPPLVGYEFPRASHPFITLMQTRVLAYKTACNLLSKCLRVYLDHLFHFKENHHLIRQRFRDTMGVKSFLLGLIYLFSEPAREARAKHDDTSSAELRLMGRTLSIEEQDWTARSNAIDYAMICTRRFLQLQGDVVEMPRALLFSDMAINAMSASLELNVRGMVRRRVKACIKHFFPLLAEPVQSILEERLLRDSKDLWMSLTADSLPPDVNVATFAHLLCHRDECLATAGAKTPAEHLDTKAGCLPLAFWCDSLSQLTLQVQDSVAILFTPAYWGISGSYDLRTMLRNGSKDMRAMQEYNRRTVWTQVKGLPEQYLNGKYIARHGDWLSGPSATDIRWHANPEWDAQWSCFIDHVVVAAGHAYYGTVGNVTPAALRASMLASASTVPALYLLDSVFSIKRIPRGHILSGVIHSDGHALCVGMFHVERGHRTLLSNGAASVPDVLLAEGKHSALIGLRLQAAGAALGDEEESDESALDLRSALLRLPSIARLKQDRTLVHDSGFHGEFETRQGLPKYLKHVKNFARPAGTPRRLIGIDSGEVRENKLVDTVRDSVGVMSRVSSLEFSSKPARAARKRRATRAARLRASFPLKLDKMLEHMGQSDVYKAAKVLFESSQSVRRHRLKAYAQDRVRYSSMLAQVSSGDVKT